MSRRDHDNRLNTPTPEELEKPATVGYVHLSISTYQNSCKDEQADARNKQWSEITRIKDMMGKILGGLKLAAWLGPVLLTLALGASIPLIRWAVKGVIAEELDKRVFVQSKIASKETATPAPFATSTSNPSW